MPLRQQGDTEKLREALDLLTHGTWVAYKEPGSGDTTHATIYGPRLDRVRLLLAEVLGDQGAIHDVEKSLRHAKSKGRTPDENPMPYYGR